MSAGILTYDKGATDSETWHRDDAYELMESIPLSKIAEVFDFRFYSHPSPYPILGPADEEGNRQVVEIAYRDDAVSIVREGGTDRHGDPAPNLGMSEMGSVYRINQYEEWFTALAEVCIQQGCHITSVGTLGNSAKGFMSVVLPEGSKLVLPGGDHASLMLNFGESCDGTSTSRAVSTLNRIECANTWQCNLLQVPSFWSIRHTTNAEMRLDEAAAALDEAVHQADLIGQRIGRMVDAVFSEADFGALVGSDACLGERPDEEGAAQTRYDNKFSAINDAYWDDNLDGVRDTRWGAFNAIQNWTQYGKETRGKVSAASRNIQETIFTKSDPMLTRVAKELVIA